MLAFIRGELQSKTQEYGVLDVSGVGFMLRLSPNHLHKLSVGQVYQIPVWLLHREDNMELFGFETQDAKELFLHLMNVNGIGAKSALTIISELELSQIVQAVVANQPKLLTLASGVGLKTAQRIVLELKEKLKKWKPDLSLEAQSLGVDKVEEIELTLQALGYAPQEIQKAIQTASISENENLSADEIIPICIAFLSQND